MHLALPTGKLLSCEALGWKEFQIMFSKAYIQYKSSLRTFLDLTLWLYLEPFAVVHKEQTCGWAGGDMKPIPNSSKLGAGQFPILLCFLDTPCLLIVFFFNKCYHRIGLFIIFTMMYKHTLYNLRNYNEVKLIIVIKDIDVLMFMFYYGWSCLE